SVHELSRTFELAGRNWTLHLRASQPFLDRLPGPTPLSVGLAGVLLSTVLAGLLLLFARSAQATVWRAHGSGRAVAIGPLAFFTSRLVRRGLLLGAVLLLAGLAVGYHFDFSHAMDHAQQ